MLGSSSRDTEEGIVLRLCAGGCGVVLRYKLETSCQPYVPDLYCQNGNSAYRGGHLCNDCEIVVAEALTRRRDTMRLAATQADGKIRTTQGRARARRKR